MKKQKEADKKKGSNEKGANRGLTLEERRHRYMYGIDTQFNFENDYVGHKCPMSLSLKRAGI